MSDIHYAQLWQVWDWPIGDGKAMYAIGYTTRNGTGDTIATDLTKENAEYIVGLVHRAATSKTRRERLRKKRAVQAA